MNEEIYKLLGEACDAARNVRNEDLSEIQITQLEDWATKSLLLSYGAGEYELDFDTSELKKSGLEIIYLCKMARGHKKISDIVSASKSLVSSLRCFCRAIAPAVEGYLDLRLSLEHPL